MEHTTTERTFQQLGAVEGRGLGHTVHFITQLNQLRLQGFAVALAVGGVRGLHGQVTHTLQHVAHLAQRAFCRLCQRDAVVGIAGSHSQATHLGAHAFGDGQTGGIVLGAVDTQARRQALHGSGQRATRQTQVALGVDRSDVGVDGHGHDAIPFIQAIVDERLLFAGACGCLCGPLHPLEAACLLRTKLLSGPLEISLAFFRIRLRRPLRPCRTQRPSSAPSPQRKTEKRGDCCVYSRYAARPSIEEFPHR